MSSLPELKPFYALCNAAFSISRLRHSIQQQISSASSIVGLIHYSDVDAIRVVEETLERCIEDLTPQPNTSQQQQRSDAEPQHSLNAVQNVANSESEPERVNGGPHLASSANVTEPQNQPHINLDMDNLDSETERANGGPHHTVP